MVIAKIIGREPGEFVHTFGDVHYYEDHLEPMKEQLKREPKTFPQVKISDEVVSLDTFRPEHVTLSNYESESTIRAEFTTAGYRNLDNKPS